MKFEIYRHYYEKESMGCFDFEVEWRWRLKAGNGEIMASGEAYTTKFNCKRCCKLINSKYPIKELQNVLDCKKLNGGI